MEKEASAAPDSNNLCCKVGELEEACNNVNPLVLILCFGSDLKDQRTEGGCKDGGHHEWGTWQTPSNVGMRPGEPGPEILDLS